MKNLLFFFFLFLSFNMVGQNLVPNPSFEEYIDCPQIISEMNATDWWSPTLSTPDYFHFCSPNEVGVPQNVFGVQEPQEGNAYVGCWLSDFMNFSEYREYVQCTLLEPLVANELYQVSFFVSRSDSSTKACDNFGCLLTPEEITAETVDNLNYSPQVFSAPGAPITESNSWVQIMDTIMANGGEQYLTLGVFTNNENTTSVNVEGGWQNEAYYYLDNVSVISLNDLNVSHQINSDWKIYPNPVNDILRIKANRNGFNVTVHTLQGELIIQEYEHTSSLEMNVSGIPSGSYVVQIFSTTESITRIIHIK